FGRLVGFALGLSLRAAFPAKKHNHVPRANVASATLAVPLSGFRTPCRFSSAHRFSAATRLMSVGSVIERESHPSDHLPAVCPLCLALVARCLMPDSPCIAAVVADRHSVGRRLQPFADRHDVRVAADQGAMVYLASDVGHYSAPEGFAPSGCHVR